MSNNTATQSPHTATARRALGGGGSGRDVGGGGGVHPPDLGAHVKPPRDRGQGGGGGGALYLELFPDLRFVVDEQVSEGDRVASRWTLHGTHRGRRVTLRGIVISRFEDGRIIEDWAASDTIEIVRQLGLWRSLLLIGKHHKLLRRPH